ncbi:serine hydrolase domain-containing protein [Aquimarina litoralis]|uniref:serine hydrolase domain-containing protein n=1 Tax=Aquimarina litoralis TaxID=584605 RepID=UPI001C569A44|nr:serine hydrolase domain-containing protein [Aquimarina litoralis]MBW1297952.1 serine hydrolase [Aquimarina litoralis]
MKTRFFTIYFLLLSIVVSSQKESTDLDLVDDFLTIEYPKNKPGAVILVAKEGNILFEKAYGLASLKPKRKLKKDMVFQIASITKQFVSAAILTLVEERKMSLKDTIQKYVPYYPSKKHPITIHHLLSQTSGIPEYFILEDDELHLLAKEHTPKELINYYKDVPLKFIPGEQWEYSNSNYPLLGAAIEKVTGMTLKEYLDQHFFEPLKMSSTGLGYPQDVKKNRIPTGYDHKNGMLFPGPKIVGSAMYAAGGMVSTTNDLFLWNRALRNHTNVSKFVIEALTTEKTLNSGKKTGYGYGFFIKDIKGSPTIQHSGNLYGFTSTALYLPEEDVFVALLTNTKYDRTDEIANYVASLLINKPLKILNSKEMSNALLKEYIGTYEMKNKDIERSFEIKLYENNLLLFDPKTPESTALLKTSEEKDVLLLKVANASFKFIRDEKNQIIGFKAAQNEDVFMFKKIK